MRLHKIFFTYIIFMLLPAFLLPAQNLPFNNKLTTGELSNLKNGEVVIRNTGSIKNICIETSDERVNKEIQIIKELNPAYLAEVIQIRPVNGNEGILNNIKDILIDIPSYKGIPYWSERHERYYDLYSSGKVISHKTQKNTDFLSAILEMSPFGEIDTDITITLSSDFLSYKNTNTNDLYYSSIRCVKIGNMKSIIIVFKFGDKWILYGIGGVDAPKIFFLKKRIEVSFINRIKTFCNFVFQKL